MKRSQIYSQVFVYILALLVISLILAYGYRFVHNFQQRANQVSCYKFENDLKNAVQRLSSDYGAVERKDLELCSPYEEICFVESFGTPSMPNNVDPVIKSDISSHLATKDWDNVFLMENVAKSFFDAGKISVEPNVLCLNATNGKISLRVEGKGNHVVISQWNE